jgi:hypothetical protein
MKAYEILSELFSPDKALPIKWPNLTHARAQLPDGRVLLVNFRPNDPESSDWTNQPWGIEFSVGDDFELTGGGEVSTIFSTVIEAIKYFMKAFHNIPALYFTAEEQSRAKMYDTLAKRVSKQLGWHVVPYNDMVNDPKYKTPLSYGDFLFAIEPGPAPEHRQAAQKPQHGEFMPVFYVVSLEEPTLPAYKVKAKKGLDAERWIMKTVPEYKDLDAFGVIARRVPPTDRQIIDKGTLPENPKPIPQDPNSLGAKLRAKLDTPQNENFADGKHPEDKGDSKRLGVPTKASVSTLRKVAKQGGRKGQLAHWMANMKAGKSKK